MLVMTTCEVHRNITVSGEEKPCGREILIAAASPPARSGCAKGQNDFFFNRAEVVSPRDGVASGGVAIPQAALARNGALEAADLGARSDGKMFLRELHTVDWANS